MDDDEYNSRVETYHVIHGYAIRHIQKLMI